MPDIQTSLRVVLIDDESQSRRTLSTILLDYCPHIEIIGEADSVRSGFLLLKETTPDAIFLDVQMTDGTGFDLLNKLPNPPFQVIFTTAYDEFALRAFRYNAIDYLLKPIDVDDLLRAVEKIRSTGKQVENDERITNLLEAGRTGPFDKIALSSNEGLQFIELGEIVRLESQVNYTTFHLLSGKNITVTKTLKSFHQLLPPEQFFRPHQSHLVNLAHIEKIMREDGGYLITRDDARIPISRSKKEQFLKLIQERFLI